MNVNINVLSGTLVTKLVAEMYALSQSDLNGNKEYFIIALSNPSCIERQRAYNRLDEMSQFLVNTILENGNLNDLWEALTSQVRQIEAIRDLLPEIKKQDAEF